MGTCKVCSFKLDEYGNCPNHVCQLRKIKNQLGDIIDYFDSVIRDEQTSLDLRYNVGRLKDIYEEIKE